MSLNSKVDLKIKFRIQTIMKSIHFFFSVGIQIFDPLLLKINFSL
jgi:hypothetical protein